MPKQTPPVIRLEPRTPEEKKRILKKELLFQLPVVLLAVATGFAWRSAGKDGVEAITNYGQYFFPFVFLSLLLTAYGLSAMITKKWWIFLVSGMLVTITLELLLGFSIGMVIAGSILLATWVVGFFRIRGHMDVLIRIQPWRTLRLALPSIAVALLLLTAIRVFGLSLPIVENGKLALPPNLILQVLKPLEGTLKTVVPGFNLKGNFGDLYAKAVVAEIDRELASLRGKLPPELSDLQKTAEQAGAANADTAEGLRQALKQPELQDKITREFAKTNNTGNITDGLSRQFGVTLSPSESVLSGLTKIINSELNRLAGPLIPFLPWIVALLYFLGMIALAWPAIWIAYLFTALLLRVLERTKLFDVVLVKEPVERVTLLT